MCQICSSFNPYLTDCEYSGLVAPASPDASPGYGPQAAPGDTITETGDAAGNTGTTESIATGEFFEGTLSSTSDSDWIEVQLVAGQTYTFAAMGLGALGNRATDLDMYLRDSSGTQLAYNDGLADDYNPAITYTATTTGTYYIDIQNFQGVPPFGWVVQGGDYGVSMTEGTMASYSDNMAAGNLLNTLNSWNTTPGTGPTLTWAVRASGTEPNGGNPLEGLDASQVALAETVTAYLSEISGLNMVQVNPGGTSNAATVLIGAYFSSTDGFGAYAYYPGANGGNTASNALAGDIWLNNNSFSGGSYGFGSSNAFTMLHELGHAIGLPHPGGYNAAPGVNITYADFAEYTQDTYQYTVMSYFNESNSGATFGFDFPDTFMLHDYLAIHQLYGANTGYNAGNTIYGFNASEAGSVYDFTTNTTPFMSVYDGQGEDTIDLSGYAMANWLSLVEGTFSDIGGYVGRFSIAYGAVIENAIGGTGNDTITGNDAANMIEGNGGADSIEGGRGNDTITGGEGNDYVLAGRENDSVEGGSGRDSLIGEAGNDYLSGGTDRDVLSGGNGNDTLDGGMGNDKLNGGRGNDSLNGGNRNDFLFGSTENDILFGGAGNDVVRGGAQNDYLDGGQGDDVVVGGAGSDIIIGGTGNDTLIGAFNADFFVFVDNNGIDVIEDFDALSNAEKIDFSGMSTLNSLSDVLGTGSGTAAATQVGNDVVIETGSGQITLLNVDYGDLDANDFIF